MNLLRPERPSAHWCDAAFWGLTQEQYIDWLFRLSAYHGRRAAYYTGVADQADRQRFRWLLVTVLAGLATGACIFNLLN